MLLSGFKVILQSVLCPIELMLLFGFKVMVHNLLK